MVRTGLGGGIPGYDPNESDDDSGGGSSDGTTNDPDPSGANETSDSGGDDGTIYLSGSPGNVSASDSPDDSPDTSDTDPSGANDSSDSGGDDDHDVEPIGNARERDTAAEQHGENFAHSFGSVGSGLVDKAQNFLGGGDDSEPDPSGANETETDSDGSNTTETDDEETSGAANTSDEDVIELTGSPGNVSVVGGSDDSPDPSGANNVDENPENDFNPNRQTLGTGSIDSTQDEVNVTEETDEGSSSPAGGAGLIDAVSRFTGADEDKLTEYEEQGGNAEDISQQVSDDFTEVSRQADAAGVDVDSTEVLGDSADAGTNATQDLIEGVESEIQSMTEEQTSNNASNMDPSGANNPSGPSDSPSNGDGGSPGVDDPLPGNAGGGGSGGGGAGAGPPSQTPPWAGGPGGPDGQGQDGAGGGSSGGGVLDTPEGKAAAVGGVGAIGLGAAWYLGLI